MDHLTSHDTFYRFPSPAKLNLFLHIVGRRENGYHELQTVFQFLDHGDTIEIAVNPHGTINLLTPVPDVTTEDNLIYRAAVALKTVTQSPLGADIKIAKVLPMGGGLGGGSSNAATILLALNTLWHTGLSTQRLADIGLALGADVPIFVHGFTAFAEGIGEQLTPVDAPTPWYLVTKPDVSISTAAVFQAEHLPRNTAKISANDWLLSTCRNDCQALVSELYPEVAKLLSWLVEYAPSQMTGTGACIFSCFNTKSEAEKVQSKLPPNIASFIAKGVNQSPLVAAIAHVKNAITRG